jgi:pimeloyl-ACP methyl ester carboxylesterase
MGPKNEKKYATMKEAAIKDGSSFIQVTLPKSQVTGELHYKLQGNANSKKLIVFIHGIGGGMVHFREQISTFGSLSSGFRVLALDFFGRGLSLPPTKTGSICSNVTLYDTLMHIEQIHELLNALNLLDFANITLCGFSMGGAVCMRFLDEYRLANIQNVVLCSPAGMLDAIPIIKCLQCCCCNCICPFGLNCLTSCLGTISKPQENDDRKAFFVSDTPLVDEMVRGTAEAYEVNDLQTAVFKSAARVPELSSSESIVRRVLKEQRHIRFLFIWAQNDMYVPIQPSMERYKQACIQERGEEVDCGYRIEVIEQCGHCSMLEATVKVNELMIEYLS